MHIITNRRKKGHRTTRDLKISVPDDFPFSKYTRALKIYAYIIYKDSTRLFIIYIPA